MNLRFYRAPLLAALTLLTSACREESAEPKEIVIGFSQCCSDVFREAMLFDMQIESANYPNVRLVVRNADYDNELQRQQVAELTRSADPVDVLIVSPNEAEPLTDVTVDAYLRGIPTIILDRMINSDQYSVAIGADNYQIGRTAGRYIRQHLPPGPASWRSGESPAPPRPSNGTTDCYRRSVTVTASIRSTESAAEYRSRAYRPTRKLRRHRLHLRPQRRNGPGRP